jgi:Zn-dependent protease
VPEATRCPGCGGDVAPDFLSCPACRRLVHAERLKALAAEAERAEAEAGYGRALRTWREALALLPSDSKQHDAVSAKIDILGAKGGVDATPAPPAEKGWKGVAGLGVLGVSFLLGKGKLLFLGLTKLSTLLSMFVSVAAYWAQWGWAFAVGLIVSIYIHEMGHVAAFRRYGIPASAPMFIPGLGAFIRGGSYPVTPKEDNRVGLAGPWWGLGTAAAAWLISLAAAWPLGAALAKSGAWINLFNLVPLGFLDGGRGFRSLSRVQRWAAAAAILTAYALSEEKLLLLLLAGAVLRAFGADASKKPDRGGLLAYVVLVGGLSALARLPVPGIP